MDALLRLSTALVTGTVVILSVITAGLVMIQVCEWADSIRAFIKQRHK